LYCVLGTSGGWRTPRTSLMVAQQVTLQAPFTQQVQKQTPV
jgi:hypothetical protein